MVNLGPVIQRYRAADSQIEKHRAELSVYQEMTGWSVDSVTFH